MNKKVIATIVIILLILGGGYFYWVNYYTGPYSPPRSDDDQIRLFPDFSTSTPTDTTGTTTPSDEPDDEADEDTEQTTSAPPVYQQITADPVAGATGLQQTIATPQGTSSVATTTNTFIQYQKQSNGHIFRTNPQTQSTVRVSNTTITGVQRTLFSDNGQYFAAQYISDSGNILRTVTGDVTDQSTRRLLPQNLVDIAFAPDTNDIFYIQKTENGSVGVQTDTTGESQQTIFESRLQEWLTHWHNPDQLTITTKPANGTEGYAHILSTQTGNQTNILDAVPGVTTLTSPNGERILYSRSAGPQTSLHVLNTQTNSSQRLSVSTLPEKCVWEDNQTVYCGVPASMSDANIPRAWYQGRISFNDRIVEIDVPSGITSTIVDPTQLQRPAVDAVQLGVSPDNRFLYFKNKKDGSLWSLDLFRARGEGFDG